MRIVAGRNRGRALLAPEGIDIRPTADRARQAVFDLLAHSPEMPERLLSDATVLDAFAGTGAMGLEALSRGAQRCTFLDRDPRAIACLRANAQALHELSRASFLRADATLPPAATQPATLAFLDPPYGKNLCTPALSALAESGWFAPGAIVVVEHDSGEAIEDMRGFQDIDSRRYGRAQFLFLRYGEAAA